MNSQEAANLLLQEKVLILPTDTLYGLSALAYSYDAVKSVFDIKKRPYSKSLPIHYHSIDLIQKDCVVTNKALELMNKFWPGGLTLVLRKKTNSRLVFCNDSVAVRIPNHPILLEILKILQQPLVMPSANFSNESNIYNFDKIKSLFNLDGIKDDLSIAKEPSTIVLCIDNNLEILRQGVVKI